MKPTWTSRHAARFDDGTCWALPDFDMPDDEPSLGWVQRYGSPAKREEQRLSVASVLDCYDALIRLPQRERNARVKAIRAAMNMRDNRSGEPLAEPAGKAKPASATGRGDERLREAFAELDRMLWLNAFATHSERFTIGRSIDSATGQADDKNIALACASRADDAVRRLRLLRAPDPSKPTSGGADHG
jgi:hypothetical protein